MRNESNPDGRGTARMPSIVPPFVYSGSGAYSSCPLSSSVIRLECFTKWPGAPFELTDGASVSSCGPVSSKRGSGGRTGGAALGSGSGAAVCVCGGGRGGGRGVSGLVRSQVSVERE